MPWPSCWCAWTLPPGETEQALDAYRSSVGSAYVGSRAFDDDLEIATIAWSVISVGWFLERALVGEQEPDPRIPQRRQMVQHRLRRVAGSSGPDALVSFAADVVAVLEDRWGDLRLPLGPAWRPAD